MRMPRQPVYREKVESPLKTVVGFIWEDIQNYVNGNPFSRSRLVTIPDTGTSSTDFAVEHGLGVVPLGYVVTSLNKAAIIYTGTTPWTIQNIYLQATDSNVLLGVLVFG